MNQQNRRMIKEFLENRLSELIATAESRDTAVENCADDNEYASRLTEQKLNIVLRERESKLIAEIEATLQRIDHFEFGECENCGGEIGIARLKAKPTTTLCVSCQAQLEDDQLAWVS